MENKLKRTLIIISVILNILLTSLVVVKVIIPTLKHKKRPARASLFSDKSLNLNQEQKQNIESLLKEFRVNLVSSKQEMINKRMGIIEELSSTEPDHDLIANYVEDSNKLEANLNLDFVEMMINVSNILGPGQNLDFLLKISRRWLHFGKIPKKEVNNDKKAY